MTKNEMEKLENVIEILEEKRRIVELNEEEIKNENDEIYLKRYARLIARKITLGQIINLIKKEFKID